jgi:hypothetical protein
MVFIAETPTPDKVQSIRIATSNWLVLFREQQMVVWGEDRISEGNALENCWNV